MIGRFNYDLKNHVEKLQSRHQDPVASPDISFFIPETLIFFEEGGISIQTTKSPETVYEEILSTQPVTQEIMISKLMPDTSREEYIDKVNRIKHQIIEGDFYELNYCLAFIAEGASFSPPQVYHKLNQLSPMPFSVFQGIGDHYILAASPERFLKKEGDRLVAQPIKGTIRRDPDPVIDEALRMKLKTSEKEIAENMMIVDLMRNDLSKSAVTGSVQVDEIFEIYSFSHLHQMISTISCTKNQETGIIEAIKNAFPMGSMTGAPKVRVMQEIDDYENSKRGMFSGAAGFFTPSGDFDFNVLIRSIFFDRKKNKMKYHVGSAITFDADPASEYQECLLKARAIEEALLQT